jgi:hypothetical protein
MLNHIPVLGIAFGLALVSLALLGKSEELKRISLGFLMSSHCWQFQPT